MTATSPLTAGVRRDLAGVMRTRRGARWRYAWCHTKVAYKCAGHYDDAANGLWVWSLGRKDAELLRIEE